MQNQNQNTYLPPIRALLESPVEEVCSPFSGNYSPTHTVPSPTYPSVSPQSTDAHHLAAINAHNKLNSHTSIRSLLSPPESPEMKSSGYQNYGTQSRYDVDRYIAAPQPIQPTTNQSYEEPPCSCCIKPIPVYSAPLPSPSPVSAPVYSQYIQPQPQRYNYAPLSPYDRKPTPPSLPRLNTILESLAPPKHFSHKSFVGQLSPTGSGNRYQCPYCSKRFSRPSSLRIHTYSHTGEKPFVCTEPGCGRKFSVQSNMRRHLRVHRLGRPVKKTRYDGEEGYKMINPGILRSY